MVDFCAPRHGLVIEVDGSKHAIHECEDAARTAELESQGYRVLRFWNQDVLNDMDAVGAAILEALRLI